MTAHSLEQKYQQSLAENSVLREENASLQHQLDWFKRQLFGRKSERLLAYAASHIQHMQKALMEMNLQLHHVVTDITGKTGMRILRAIVAGQRDPTVLASYRD